MNLRNFANKTVYWVAVDAFKKALSDPDTKLIASKNINTYSKGATLGGEPILYDWKINKKPDIAKKPINTFFIIPPKIGF